MNEQSMREWVTEIVMDENEDAIFFDGFDDAIIGVGAKANADPVIVYDEQKIIANLKIGRAHV